MKTPYLVISIMLIIAALAVSAIPAIIGAVKKRKILKPVEYLPPSGASPIDILIGYYGASAEPREIFNPLMLYWAERGFITIEEDCKRGLKLTKLKDLEPPVSKDGFNSETYEIELKLFKRLFSGNKTVFYTLTARSTFKEFFSDLTESCYKHAKAVTAKKSKKFTLISAISAGVMLFAVSLMVLLATENNVVMAVAFTLIAVYVPRFALLPADSPDGIPKGSALRIVIVSFFLIFGGVPFSVIIVLLPFVPAVVMSVAAAACVFIVFYLTKAVDIRTDEQLKFYARICGFKKFLLFAEVKQLEALVEEDPRYYYNVLPYCYVLKITGKLKPKFDRIALDGPAWYLGELRDTLMF